jgi:hypothetical protein
MHIHGLELRRASWGLRGQRSINSPVPRGHRGGNRPKQRALAAALMKLLEANMPAGERASAMLPC